MSFSMVQSTANVSLTAGTDSFRVLVELNKNISFLRLLRILQGFITLILANSNHEIS